MTVLIGIVGRSRVGKDTVASFFADTHQVRKFAKPIKDACKTLYNWTDDHVEGHLKETVDRVTGVSPRHAMVHLTASIRNFMGGSYFSRKLFNEWDGTTPIIITDVRYHEDLVEIHKRGGVSIKVTRTNAPRHEFETNIDNLQTTFEVVNDGSLDDLRVQIDLLGLTACAV